LKRDSRTLRTYVRAVESVLSRLRGTPAVLSQRDWHLAAGWYREGIPLGVVVETLQSRAARPPRSLSAIAPAIRETWKAVQAGRAVGPEARAIGRLDTVSTLREASARCGHDSPLGRFLAGQAERAEGGVATSVLDDLLDEALPNLAPPEAVARARADAERALAPYLDRMRPGAVADTLARSVVARLRRELDLPRLESLVHDRGGS